MKGIRFYLEMAIATLMVVWLLAACGSDDNPPPAVTPPSFDFRVTLTNITQSQPLSPMAVVLHGDTYSAWDAGESASTDLEVLAEGGSPSDLIEGADADPDVWATAAGAGVVMPGESDTVDLTATTDDSLRLSLATMLVNTNDAFGGISGASLDQLAVGQSVTYMIPAYDAGTEANSESAATVPGPAAGGEGFNSARDDVDVIHIHPGVISEQDGVADSALTGNHRWDNPVLKLVVTRTG